MSTVERWDVLLRFVAGPLSLQGDMVLQGPVVRMGANPGPGGLKLEGYRGLDDRQAVITAYDGTAVSIAPVGVNQVRVAPHENQNWAEIQAIRGPVYLSSGDAFHLGPPGRGVTAVFIKAQRLGVWEQNRILSESAQVDPGLQPSNVKELSSRRGIPIWVIPAFIVTSMFTAVGLVAVVAVRNINLDPDPLGPVIEGEEVHKFVNISSQKVDPSLKEGLRGPFEDFVMKPNEQVSGIKGLAKDEKQWDQTFYRYVEAAVSAHAAGWRFWSRLEAIKDQYAYVVTELRKSKLPEVFAAIPYQESSYRPDARSPVCAVGYWQFMPEVAFRVGIPVKDCHMSGSQGLWTPTEPVPVRGVLKNAVYVEQDPLRCRISRCDVDERTNLEVSTAGAIVALSEAWEDDQFRASGSAVQITILTHNSGYDNAKYYEDKQPNIINIKPAYNRYLKDKKVERAVDFYGQNITCTGTEAGQIMESNNRCGGVIANQSQHYAYSIVAQHILAVCYYAKNHGDMSAFKQWNRDYVIGDGYCDKLKGVPSLDEIKARGGS